jgi:Alpha/beta hydrolase domain
MPANNGPQQHYVVDAALAQLNNWVATGRVPPAGARIELIPGNPPTLELDANGNALGGVRTPWVDVPTSRLSGVGSMFGSTATYNNAKLEQLYPGGRDEYLRKFEVSLDHTIQPGFILAADRQEILELARLCYRETPPPNSHLP